MTDVRPLGADEAAFIAVVRSGDTARFALITERHRRELQVHCYRMLANYEDALAQDTSEAAEEIRRLLRQFRDATRRVDHAADAVGAAVAAADEAAAIENNGVTQDVVEAFASIERDLAMAIDEYERRRGGA